MNDLCTSGLCADPLAIACVSEMFPLRKRHTVSVAPVCDCHVALHLKDSGNNLRRETAVVKWSSLFFKNVQQICCQCDTNVMLIHDGHRANGE